MCRTYIVAGGQRLLPPAAELGSPEVRRRRSEKKARAAEHDESMARAPLYQIKQMRAENVARHAVKAAVTAAKVLPARCCRSCPPAGIPTRQARTWCAGSTGQPGPTRPAPPPGHWAIS